MDIKDYFNNKEFSRLICEPVVAMADGAWPRTQQLIAEGFDSFTPAMRFCQVYFGEETFRVIVEIKTIQKRFALNQNWPYQWPNNWEQLKSFVTNMGYAPNALSSEPLFKLSNSDMSAYLDLVAPYYEEMEKLRVQEIERFSVGTFKKLSDETASRIKVYNEIMRRMAPAMGFTLDRDISTSRLKIYSKECLGPLRLCLWIDKYELNRQYILPVVGSKYKIQLRAIGPSVQLKFGLVNSQDEGSVDVVRSSLSFRVSDFFLVQWPLLPKFFAALKSLHELEAMLVAHLKMYELIKNEFEVRLREGVGRALNAWENGICDEFRFAVSFDEWRRDFCGMNV